MPYKHVFVASKYEIVLNLELKTQDFMSKY